MAISEGKIAEDAKWDSLKGDVTNTDLPAKDAVEEYHGLGVSLSNAAPHAAGRNYTGNSLQTEWKAHYGMYGLKLPLHNDSTIAGRSFFQEANNASFERQKSRPNISLIVLFFARIATWSIKGSEK